MARTTKSTDKKLKLTPSKAKTMPALNTSAPAKPARKTTSQAFGTKSVETRPKPQPAPRGRPAVSTKTSRAGDRGKADAPAISSKAFRVGSKGAAVVDLLRQEDGATIAMLTEATGWQQHSVRGFISGALKKDRGITITSQKDGAGNRRYKVVGGG